MLIGDESPQWAQDLMYHWITYHDHIHGIDDMKAFCFYTDYFDYNSPQKQVRIFAVPYETAFREAQTGEREAGLYATYVIQSECRIIDTPEGLEEWTVKESAGSDNA